MTLKSLLISLLGMSALTACETHQPNLDSFCYLYNPVKFSTYEAKAAIVDNNDKAEQIIVMNNTIYDLRCKNK